MTAEAGSSGFISRNNDDPTAEVTFEIMRRAGIPRELTITWNVVPWWDSTRKVTGQELIEGIACVQELIALLPKLRVVVLVGGQAAKARVYREGTGLAVFTSAHPSPLVKARFPDKCNAIPVEWAKAVEFINGNFPRPATYRPQQNTGDMKKPGANRGEIRRSYF
jgi:hypothetical protein